MSWNDVKSCITNLQLTLNKRLEKSMFLVLFKIQKAYVTILWGVKNTATTMLECPTTSIDSEENLSYGIVCKNIGPPT